MRIGTLSTADVTLNGRTISNSGNIVWDYGDINTAGNARIENDGTFTIRTNQSINGPVTALIINQNNGLIQKVVPGESLIQIPVENRGRVELNGAEIRFQRGFRQVQGNVRLGGGTMTVTGDFQQDAGSTKLEGGTLAVTGALLQDGGTILLENGQIQATGGLMIGANALLAGSGTLVGDVTNNGTIEVGGAGQVGDVFITGNYTQGGTLIIELLNSQPGQYDRLVVNGLASLGGTLQIRTLPNFATSEYDEFEILTFGSREGDFASMNGLVLWDGLYLDGCNHVLPGDYAAFLKKVVEDGLPLATVADHSLPAALATSHVRGARRFF